MEHVFPFQLLNEGKLQLFPNGVLDFLFTNDAGSLQGANGPDQAT